MATYLLWTGGNDTDGSEAGGWSNAFTTIALAAAAATASGDVIKCHKASQLALGAHAFTSGVSVFCVDKDASDALAQMDGTTGYWQTGTNAAVGAGTNGNLYLYGLAIQGTTTNNRSINLGTGDGSHTTLENCRIGFVAAANGVAGISGRNVVDHQTYVRFLNCTFVAAGTSTHISLSGKVDAIGCTVELFSGASAPVGFLKSGGQDPGGSEGRFLGCDFSALGSEPIVASIGGTVAGTVTLSQCKLGSGYELLEGAPVPANMANMEVFAFDCSSDGTQGLFGYANGFGSVVSDTGVHLTAGAAAQSWKIVTTANCSYYTPFETPWISLYHTGTSAIEPYLEFLRNNDGTTSTYDNDEVWIDVLAKVTTGSTQSSLSTDRMALRGTPAAQTSSTLGAGDWTGEAGTCAYGILKVPSLTPAESGHIMARVCVGIEITGKLHVDPQIRT